MGIITMTDIACTEHVGVPFAAYATPVLADIVAVQGMGVPSTIVADGAAGRDRFEIEASFKATGLVADRISADHTSANPTTRFFANGAHRSASWSPPV